MLVIQAHRQRIDELHRNFTRLLEQEAELFDTRSKSWDLQMQGDINRESELVAVHDVIDGIGLEIERLREILATPRRPAAREAHQAATADSDAAPDASPSGGTREEIPVL